MIVFFKLLLGEIAKCHGGVVLRTCGCHLHVLQFIGFECVELLGLCFYRHCQQSDAERCER